MILFLNSPIAFKFTWTEECRETRSSAYFPWSCIVINLIDSAQYIFLVFYLSSMTEEAD